MTTGAWYLPAGDKEWYARLNDDGLNDEPFQRRIRQGCYVSGLALEEPPVHEPMKLVSPFERALIQRKAEQRKRDAPSEHLERLGFQREAQRLRQKAHRPTVARPAQSLRAPGVTIPRSHFSVDLMRQLTQLGRPIRTYACDADHIRIEGAYLSPSGTIISLP